MNDSFEKLEGVLNDLYGMAYLSDARGDDDLARSLRAMAVKIQNFIRDNTDGGESES